MTLTKYIIGFILSLILTLAAYFMVVEDVATGMTIILILGVLALVQMVVQLVFFLHLGEEVGPRYKLASFLFMGGILLIIVVGSIWIMDNLNYNMMEMSPQQKSDYMKTQHDKGF
jgi:cytochrome o ubiquinol oxidase operon protein cyoD